MAYSNYYPTYQPYQFPVYPQAQTQAQSQSQTSNGIVWVQGEAGAKAYPVASGNSVVLMDSESECFYIKSTDVSGMPLPLRTFTYSEVVAQQPQQVPQIVQPQIDTSQFVTRDELNNILSRFTQPAPINNSIGKEKKTNGKQTVSANTGE